MHSILLVDDEPTVLKLTKMILEKNHFKITAFSSPVQALKSFDPNEFDLIISDLVMPEMNGIELLKEIRKIVPLSKAIIISASAGMARLQEDPESDTHYLSKPFQFNELIDLINKIL
ncbi:response regulator [Lentisphaera profundi]|uniref:Response regulator n=1 Tax=Lentisphaera profundi TaxID=1658616 RepID=A0ABY7W4D2_9BACT|nr:response regulator [Lentisphaera profundi]WDE99103.1 response regulator [Lentisphaera profundi]